MNITYIHDKVLETCHIQKQSYLTIQYHNTIYLYIMSTYIMWPTIRLSVQVWSKPQTCYILHNIKYHKLNYGNQCGIIKNTPYRHIPEPSVQLVYP